MDKVIEAEDLTKTYAGGVKAIDGILSM